MGFATTNTLVGPEADLLAYSRALEDQIAAYQDAVSAQADAMEAATIRAALTAEHYRVLHQCVGEFLRLVTIGADPAAITAARKRMKRAYEALERCVVNSDDPVYRRNG